MSFKKPIQMHVNLGEKIEENKISISCILAMTRRYHRQYSILYFRKDCNYVQRKVLIQYN